MAGELTVGANLEIRRTNVDSRRRYSKKLDQSTSGVHVATDTITSTAANLGTGAIATAGWFWCQNVSKNNETILLGVNVSSVFFSVAKLRANEAAVFRVDSGATLMAKTPTNNGTLSFVLCED